MITREADYAIRAVLYLSSQPRGRLVATSELAEEMLVPYRFLRRIVQRLVESGLVHAQRGKGGGIRLTRPCQEITLLDVMQIIDPKALCVNLCLDDPAACQRALFCSVRPCLEGLQSRIAAELARIRFDQLLTGCKDQAENSVAAEAVGKG